MPFELIPPGTHFDFIGKWKIAVSISLAIILAGVAAFFVRGPRFGIDFAGGTEMLVRFEEGAAVDEAGIRQVVAGAGVADASVVRFRETGAPMFSLYFAGQPGEKAELVDALQQSLAARFGAVEVDRVDFVGPRVGQELRRDGVNALLISFVLILAYIGFRFSPRFAPGAVVALIHDVLVTASIWLILGWEFDLTVLAALLTIVGYSVNDTIVVFDRIRETMQLRTKSDLTEVINLAINQTLGRTVLTSGLTLLSVLALLFVGGEMIRPFAAAMTIGIFAGVYSTIYIAAALLLYLETRHARAGTGAAAPARSRS